ncbi:MAG: DUF1795 domain-containing protein [candidate division Zixibacteria bacterium]|nr:DUF1795 domain-containing protein [candidate division Zixibacteria bacterium]MDH3937330.1 DUF1795 domain-containing protein [candidate division Zixibacteria bacterium]MDH4033522.1 DUF1795 domain-containing protein [candidate division Zixibacteria bacterium]
MAASNNGFKIDLPDGWEDQTIHYFMGPEESGLQHILSLQVDTQPSSNDLEEYARDRVEQMLESIPDAEVLKEEEKQLPSGAQAYEVVYKWAPSEDKVVFQKLVFVQHSKTMYNFNGTFTKKTIKTLGVEVDRMIQAFIPGSEL